MNDRYNDKIEEVKKRFQELKVLLADNEVISNPQRLKEVNQEFQYLNYVVEVINNYEKISNDLEGARITLAEAEDEEMKEMASTEIEELEELYPEAESKLRIALIPPDPNDKNDAILEIRAGAGGDEAALFAGDLFRMYSKFAENNGYKVVLASDSQNDLGGLKEVIFEIQGNGAYGAMKYESGVHRVQRVPSTEKQGRVHTSTATVAVLPKVEKEDFDLDVADLKIETTTSQGAGGQHVNTTQSAVRMTHIPTGITVYCQQERSQHQNREKAMEIMRARVFAHEEEKRMAEASEKRLSQIGTGDRSEKIRTYNFPQDRLTDHRIKQSWHGLSEILEGKLDHITSALKLADEK